MYGAAGRSPRNFFTDAFYFQLHRHGLQERGTLRSVPLFLNDIGINLITFPFHGGGSDCLPRFAFQHGIAVPASMLAKIRSTSRRIAAGGAGGVTTGGGSLFITEDFFILSGIELV